MIMDGKKVNSCMVLAALANGSESLTVEGLVESDGVMHPIQEAHIDTGAIQCGFCIPGMVISGNDLLKNKPTRDDIKMAISGNLCRYTG